MADDIKTYNFPTEQGITMYGATMKDDYGPLHYVMFHSHDGKTTKLGRIDEDDNGTRMRNLRCGAYCGDKYYGFLVNMYSYVEEPKAFGTVDFSTGTFTQIRGDYNKAERVSWPTLYEMTYDNANKVCYALGRNMDGLFVSDLYKINLETGDYDMLCTLDFYAWAMACDYDGNLYMVKGIPDKKGEFYEASSVVRIDTKDNYAEKDEVRIKQNGADFIPNYTHSMEFDHNSNRLYWLAMSNDGWQKLYELDQYTGNAVKTADMMYNMVAGLYIPFKGADSRMAAGKVKELKGEPAEDASLKAMLEWETPTSTWKGDALEALHSVSVARGSEGNVIATLPANDKRGEKMTFTDESAEKGYNVYYVTTHRLEGENGLTDSVRVYVGPDTPGRPQNIEVKAEGKNVLVSWVAPETGAHGEKYDLGTTVYDVTRMPDNVTVAKGVKETSVLDDKIGTKKNYTYVVKAYNAEGEGLSNESAPILVGSAFPLPFVENFDTDLCKGMWTSVDANNDGIYFEWAGGVVEDFFRYQVWLNNQHDTNDYMITPPLATKKGTSYRAVYEVQVGKMADLHKFVFVTGEQPTAAGMTNRVDSVDNLKCEKYDEIFTYETKFTAGSDETYAGINCMSYASGSGSYFAVRSFKVEEIFAADLGALSMTGSKDFIAGEPAQMNIMVKNFGADAKDSYKVEVVAKDAEGNITVLGSKEVKETIAPDQTAEVMVEAVATTEGAVELAARVVLDGDMNSLNDMTAWTEYNVNPAGTTDWNITCEGEKIAPSTTEPMNFYNIYSTVETVYLKEEIKAEKDGRITRIAYQYSDNSLAAATDECDVKIYMANSDKTGYEAQAYAEDWTPLEESTLVCTKTIRIEPGTDNLLVFELDTPFEYDHTKNLVVQVWKEGALDEMFPALFKNYNFGWEVFRGLRYNTNKIPFDFEDSKDFFSVNNVPVLHMAVDFEDHSGIFEINGANGMSYENGVLAICNGEMRSVQVTDVAGRVVFSENVNAQSVRLDLRGGLYIIRAVDAEGTTHVMKVSGR